MSSASSEGIRPLVTGRSTWQTDEEERIALCGGGQQAILFTCDHLVENLGQFLYTIRLRHDPLETVTSEIGHDRIVGVPAGDDALDVGSHFQHFSHRLLPSHPSRNGQIQDDDIERLPFRHCFYIQLQRFSAIPCIPVRDPVRARPTDSWRIFSIGWTCLTGAPPLEKARNCIVSSRARRHAFRASSILAKAISSSPLWRRAKEMFPMMAVKILLKSWAMTPARTPTDSSFSVLMSSSSTSRMPVLSRKTMIAPMTRPTGSRTGTPWAPIPRSVPSREISRVSSVSVATTPILMIFFIGFERD